MCSARVTRGRIANANAYTYQEVSPLTVMLKKMRFEFAIARAEAAKGTVADHNIIRKALDSAHAAAKDCAPYVHRRLSSLDESNTAFGDLSKLSDKDLNTLVRLTKKYGKNSDKAA
jgi:hypothetical protein